MPEVLFVNENKTVFVKSGATLLQAARLAGVMIESPCNAMGTCGKCRVRVENEFQYATDAGSSRHQLSPAEEAAGYVLACQTKIYGNLRVFSQDTAQSNRTLKILSDGQSFSYKIAPYIAKRFDGKKTVVYGGGEPLGEEEGDTSCRCYGVVADIGTTTLVAALVDLQTGREITTISALNPQSLHAQDVLTRIHLASDEAGLLLMYEKVTNEMERMIGAAAEQSGICRADIYEVVFSGNTAMIHLACNVSPKTLGRYPYTPMITGGNRAPAKGLNISRFGSVYLPPVISAFVGPDITSGILAVQLHKTGRTTLFIDIGTNGEMALAAEGALCATSTAAGPAFEGMNIQCGMRAGQGAIEYYRIGENGDAELHTIGDAPAKGICGSGLMDIVGELVHAGVIGKNGRFAPKGRSPQALASRLFEKEGKLAFQITDEVFLTQQDIRQVQLAKGAIRSGIEALLLNRGVQAQEVERVLIAGSFGYHLREESLLHIGLLPEPFAGKVEFVGNTSKSGGKAFLLNEGLRSEMRGLVEKIETVELANSKGFEKLFVGSLGF